MNDNIQATWLWELFANAGLVEILTHLHGSAGAPATYQQGDSPSKDTSKTGQGQVI